MLVGGASLTGNLAKITHGPLGRWARKSNRVDEYEMLIQRQCGAATTPRLWHRMSRHSLSTVVDGLLVDGTEIGDEHEIASAVDLSTKRCQPPGGEMLRRDAKSRTSASKRGTNGVEAAAGEDEPAASRDLKLALA